MSTGLLNLFYPLFDWLNGLFFGWAYLTIQVVFWGSLAGASSMALYWLVSPQGKLKEVGERTRESRRRLLDSKETTLAKSLGVACELIQLSGQQVLLALLPTLAAAIPFLSLLAWTSDRYGYELPQGGEAVNVFVVPEGTGVQSVPAALLSDKHSRLRIFWPSSGDSILLLDNDGRNLLRLSGDSPVTVVHKHSWWNWLFGNTAGYLPDDTAVEAITFQLKPKALLDFGPDWVQSAELIFIGTAFVVSLAMKFTFNIR